MTPRIPTPPSFATTALRSSRHTGALRVWFVIGNLRPDGVQRSTIELARELPHHGIEPTIVAVEDSAPSLLHEATRHGIAVHVLRPGRRWSWIVQLRALLREHRPDLVCSAMPFADLVARLASVGTGIPGAMSFVDTFTYVEPWPAPAGAGRVAQGRVAATNALVWWAARHLPDGYDAAGSTAGRVSARALGIPPQSVTTVVRGRSPGDFAPEHATSRRQIRDELGLGSDEILAVAVGRLHPVKGFDVLVHAVARLPERLPLHVAIAGRDDGAGEELRRLVEHHRLGERVHLLGHRDDVPSLLRAADLAVQSSRAEGGPAVAIEAFAAGTPTVLSRLDCVTDLVEDGVHAVLADPGDVAQLAAAITTVLDDPDAASRRATAARRLFDEAFAIESVARAAAAFHRATVSAAGPRPRTSRVAAFVPGRRDLRRSSSC